MEAEVIRPRPRKLTDADLASLTEKPNVTSYYALAVSFPQSHWVLVPASKFAVRNLAAPNILLEALSDKEYSEEWTREYVGLLQDAGHQIRLASFSDLRQIALAGRGL